MKPADCLFALIMVAPAAFADAPPAFVGEPPCLVAKPILKPDEFVTWQGACKDGYAAGPGVLQKFRQSPLTQIAGARYEVTMAQGRIVGEGTLKEVNGDTYIGTFRDGQRDGDGYTVYANGNRHEGAYRNDLPNGPGIGVDYDRDRYEGGWKDGKFDGAGSRTYELGGRYDGSWKNGKFDGRGMLTYAGSGRRLVAEFEDGRVRGTSAPAPVSGQRYGLDRQGIAAGSLFPRPRLVEGYVPFDKSYGELTAEQQIIAKRFYRTLEEGDEPPYPIHGLAPIFTWIKKAQAKALVAGELRLDVLVGKDGKALSVVIIRTPTPELAKFVALVVMKEQYKPAVCHGAPCEMMYPFNMNFAVD